MSDTSTGTVTGRHFDRGALAVAMITIALTTWPIAFNLGAYDEVFYEDVFNVVVASTVGLAIAVMVPPRSGRRRWFTITALAAPGLWLALAVTLFDSTTEAASNGVFGFLAFVVAIVAVPAILRLLIDLFVPDITSIGDTKVLVWAVAVLVFVAVAGFTVGANNDAFLTCRDFEVAGSDKPANCAPADAP